MALVQPLVRTKSLAMTRRTYEADAEHVETADDLDDLVHDKREDWRATSSKARRRQRRYKKRLTNELLRMDIQMTNEKDVEKQKLMKELIENSKSQEDKLTALRVIANQDSQKATNAIKSLMKKK